MLVLLIGVIDYQTGYELSFSLFYLIPICLATWVAGRDMGLLVSILSACVWYVADALSGHVYSLPIISLWNTGMRLGFFVVVTFLLSDLRKTLDHERSLSRTDHLTGAANTRAFLETIQLEIDRFERYRHAFTVVYIDLDNFKVVNDRYGHLAGDKVLHAIVAEIRKRLRKSDMVGRLGGDEFGLFLPETGQDASQAVVKKIRAGILESMQLRKMPVTASLGVVTCEGIPKSPEILIKMADELMYSIKHHGKDGIGYSIFRGMSVVLTSVLPMQKFTEKIFYEAVSSHGNSFRGRKTYRRSHPPHSAGVDLVVARQGMDYNVYWRGRIAEPEDGMFIKQRIDGTIRLSRYREFMWFVIITTFLGAASSGGAFGVRLVTALVANWLAVAFIFMINDVEDAQDDALSPHKAMRNPVASGMLSHRSGRLASGLVAALAALLFLLLGFGSAIWGLLSLLLGYIYSWKKIRLKNFPLLDVLSHSMMLAGCQFLAAFFAFSPGLHWWWPVVFCMPVSISMYGELFNELRDFHKDREAGLSHTAAILGYRPTMVMMHTLLGLASPRPFSHCW